MTWKQLGLRKLRACDKVRRDDVEWSNPDIPPIDISYMINSPLKHLIGLRVDSSEIQNYSNTFFRKINVTC